jgi:hypothetical protein
MRGKLVVAGLVGAILLVCGVIFWVGIHGGSTHEPPSAPGVGFVKAPPPHGDADAGAGRR